MDYQSGESVKTQMSSLKISSQESCESSPEAEAVMHRCAEARLRNTGIPAKHLETALKLPSKWGEKMNTLTSKLNKGGMMFALIGLRGTGKTQMATELIRYAVKQNMECKYSRAMEFFMDIKETYRGDYASRTEAQVIQAYVKPQLLVLDEMQERGATEWEDRLLTYMVDKRYGALKDTLLIGNQKADAFGATIGNSILSRLMETGAILQCEWESFR